MTNQTISKSIPSNRTPLQLERVAFYRLIIDAIVFTIILLLIRPIINTEAGINILISVSSILLSTLIGYILVRRGHSTMGPGFIIYGLIFGFFGISFIVEGLGGFTLFILVLITSLSITTNVSPRLRMYAMIISVAIGSAAFLIDINTKGASYRVAPPEIINVILWFISAVIILLIGSIFFRQFPLLPFRTKIISSLVILTIVSIAILGYLNNSSVKTSLIQNANDNLFTAGSRTIDSITAFIDSNLDIIKTEGFIPVFIDYINTPLSIRTDSPLRNQAISILLSFREENPDFVATDQTFEFVSSYAILDLEGNIILSSDEMDIGIYEGDMSYFTYVIETGLPSFSPNEVSPSTGRNYLYFAAPIKEPLKEIKGVIRVRLEPQILQNVLDTSKDLIGEDSYAVLFKKEPFHMVDFTNPEEERFILSAVLPLSNNLYPQLAAEKYPYASQNTTHFELEPIGKILHQWQNDAAGLENFIAEGVLTGRSENQVVVMDVENTPWVLVFFQPIDIFLKPVGSMANSTIIFGLITVSIAVGIALSLTNLLTKPITDLTESAKEVSKGNLEVRIDVTTEDEIGELSSAFNLMTAQLQNLVTNLEEQVSGRTRELQNQAAQLQAAVEVSRDATSELEMEGLLSRSVNLIAERFGFSHVAIYLTDHREIFAVMMAGNGSIGNQLVSNGHRFRVSNDSNIGYVCKNGESRIASIDNELTQISYHPLLQNSASEMVLPLKVGEKILGAIDIHSTNPKAFSENDIPIFQTIADQLSIAIQKTEYREEIQKTLDELETAYGRATREAWESYVQGQDTTGYRYQHMSVEPTETNPAEVLEAWELAETIIHKDSDYSGETKGSSVMAIPLKVRGGVIGVLSIQVETDQIPSDTVNLFEEITNRLSFVLENARLVESAQKRVDQELLTSDITNKMRQTLDLDAVLQTAVKEISENLGLAEVEIRMGHIMESSTAQSIDGNSKENTPDQPDELLEAYYD